MHQKVVVTGLGALTSMGADAAALWDGLKHARSAIAPLQRFDVEKYRTRIGGEVTADVSALLGWNVASLSRNAQFSLAAAADALADSGVLNIPTGGADIGICLGSGLGGIYYSEEAIAALGKVGPRGVSPMTVPFVDPNSIVSQIAMKWGLTGRQFTVSTACSSSAHAVGMAMEMIRYGRCDAVLTGGVEATISPLVFAGFDRLRAMSARNDTPTLACRPFSDDRDGFVMAEGAAMLMLESEAHAKARGAKIYAQVLGYGATGGAFHAVMPRPDGSDLVASMTRALADAGVQAGQIDMINPHGTGTMLNDEAERVALQALFGAHLADIAVTPTKQLTGHLLGAAGAIESLHLVKSIAESCVTPIAHVNGTSGLNIRTGEAYDRRIQYAVNNSFGFGNNNVSLVFGAYA